MDANTPAGRMVQGKLEMQQRQDMTTRQPMWKDVAKTIPDTGIFFSVAFPKLIDGQPNAEFAEFYGKMQQVAYESWPQFFPQGAQGACNNPNFSWKLQDGDGVDKMGQSVATKAGFPGHWIIKFDTDYDVKSYYDGKFAAHEVIQNPAEIIKRGYWISVYCEMRSNNADLTKRQVPGISIYPKLVTFIGGRKEDEIQSGPDAMEVLGKRQAGWRPGGISVVPGAPVGTGLPTPGVHGGPATGLGLPGAPGSLSLPSLAPSAPAYMVTPAALAAMPGATVDVLKAQGHTVEQLLAAGYIAAAPAAPVLTQLAPAAPVLPQLGAMTMPTAPALIVMPPAPAAQPVYAIVPGKVPAGVTIESLLAQSWTIDALLQGNYIVRTA